MKLKDTEQLEEVLVAAIEAVRQHDIKTAGLDELEAVLTYLRAIPETHEECTETHACDCISRQAAIDVLDRTTGITYEQWTKMQSAINKLPSIQPDLSEYSDKLWKNAYERGKAERRRHRKSQNGTLVNICR